MRDVDVLALGVGGYLWMLGSGQIASVGAAAVGGPFELVDQNGKRFGTKQLAGKPYAIFFGFTRCPEVCPTTLYEMSGWFDALGEEGKVLKAFFFSVDPERDSPELMHNYAIAFTNRITGITGDPAEMRKLMKAWRIYAAKVPTQDGDYTMDHTASVLLINSKGEFMGSIAYGEAADSAVSKIRKLIQQDKAS